jgi:3-methyladenine DNA glycosylase AlkD
MVNKMNLKLEKWTKKDYDNFVNYLYTISDTKYKEFAANIGTNKNIIGVRVPVLRTIAKEISLGNYESFINLDQHKTREEIIIHGLILGYIKIPFNKLILMLDDFLKYNNSWETNDITVSNLKIFKKNRELGLDYINNLVKSNNPYTVRFGLILLLDYYKDPCYTNISLNIIDNLKLDDYYVKMGEAWLVSELFINDSQTVLKWLKKTNLDKFTYNKSISKICDSYRVPDKTKIMLKKMNKNE